MGAPQAAAVQLFSEILLFYWADSGTETGLEPGALRLGEQQVEQQVAILLAILPCLKQGK